MADQPRPPQSRSGDVPPGPGDVDVIRRERDRLQLVVTDLTRKIKSLEEQLETATTMTEVTPVIASRPELRKTLSTLVKRIGMIVQGEKCVIMLYNPEAGVLEVLPPALGISEDQARVFKVRATEGVTGEIFRERRLVRYDDAVRDDRTIKENVAFLHVRNGIGAPLVIKRRDEDEQVTDEQCIGVIHVFNKRGADGFNEDDMRLLEMLATQAAAVISNAQLYIKIQEEKEQLEATFQSIQAGVIVVNRTGQVRLVNAAARQICGIADPEVGAKGFGEVFEEGEISRLLGDTMRHDEEVAREITMVTPSRGERIFQGQTTLIRGENGSTQNIVAILNDITEIRNVERMKTAFVSTVSHELRTPLTSIKGFISTLLEDKEEYYDKDTRLEFYQIIDEECDRLTRLISDLLNISRIEAGRALELVLTEVNVYDLCLRVAQAQQSYTTKHTVVCTVPRDFPHIVADQDKVDQILTNLVGNAIKYSPEGGQVTVGGQDEGANVLLMIQDEGLGIPEHHRERIWERFHRVDDNVDSQAVSGTGIGLYLVKHLAQAHGGDVWLDWSEAGVGSRFAVRLPKEPPQREEA
jgi:PAS domain S-box-containing protein